MRRLGGIAVVLLALLTAAAGGAWIYLQQLFEAPGPLTEEATLVVPRGAGLTTIGELLAEAGVISDARIFALGVRLFAEPTALKAGEYAFEPGSSMAQAADLIASGRTLVHRLTVPEGLTSAEVVALLADGEPWSAAALALATGASRRTMQRALKALGDEGRVTAIGRGPKRRWVSPPLTRIATAMLLPPAGHAG